MDHPLVFHFITYGSPEYEACLELRRRVLLEPVGVVLRSEDIESEAGDLHLAGWLGSELVACLILTPLDQTLVRMRQVAVSSAHQGCGLGRELVSCSEREARARGYTVLVAHAREGVVGFYEKLGYQVVGERFTEVNLPHWKVQKSLVEVPL